MSKKTTKMMMLVIEYCSYLLSVHFLSNSLCKLVFEGCEHQQLIGMVINLNLNLLSWLYLLRRYLTGTMFSRWFSDDFSYPVKAIRSVLLWFPP